jgi:hypothetical protein
MHQADVFDYQIIFQKYKEKSCYANRIKQLSENSFLKVERFIG